MLTSVRACINISHSQKVDALSTHTQSLTHPRQPRIRTHTTSHNPPSFCWPICVSLSLHAYTVVITQFPRINILICTLFYAEWNGVVWSRASTLCVHFHTSCTWHISLWLSFPSRLISSHPISFRLVCRSRSASLQYL